MSKSLEKYYKVVKKLGSGGFADVYCVQRIQTGKLFAAKVMRDKHTGPDASKELAVMRQLQHHANILQLIEYLYDSTTQQLVLILELMDMNLHQYLSDLERPMSETRARLIFYSVLKAVHYIHTAGFFHRDIKPENILLKFDAVDADADDGTMVRKQRRRQCIVKLADLGCTKQFRNGRQQQPPYTEYMATRWYRAPECILTNGFYGPKMDIWALGCVFYEILMLKPLFPGNNEIDQLHKIHTILGPPTIKMLAKYKEKFSEVYFKSIHLHPKSIAGSVSQRGAGDTRAATATAAASTISTKGLGLQMIMCNVSPDAVKILNQMLVYDPDKRSNIQRILNKSYFEPAIKTNRTVTKVKTIATATPNN